MAYRIRKKVMKKSRCSNPKHLWRLQEADKDPVAELAKPQQRPGPDGYGQSA
jgi:hypothetical protein